MMDANSGASGGYLVLCPYYKRHGRQIIVCEGPLPNTNSGLRFPEPQARREHMHDFCETGCWQGCPVATAAAEKWEK